MNSNWIFPLCKLRMGNSKYSVIWNNLNKKVEKRQIHLHLNFWYFHFCCICIFHFFLYFAMERPNLRDIWENVRRWEKGKCILIVFVLVLSMEQPNLRDIWAGRECKKVGGRRVQHSLLLSTKPGWLSQEVTIEFRGNFRVIIRYKNFLSKMSTKPGWLSEEVRA